MDIIIELILSNKIMTRPSGVYHWSKFWGVGKYFMYLWEAMGPCCFRIIWSHLIEFSFSSFSPNISLPDNFVGLSFELL